MAVGNGASSIGVRDIQFETSQSNSVSVSLRSLLGNMQPSGSVGSNDSIRDFLNFSDTYPIQPYDFTSQTVDIAGALCTSNDIYVYGICPHENNGPTVGGGDTPGFSLNGGAYSTTTREGLASTYVGGNWVLKINAKAYAPLAVGTATYGYTFTEKSPGTRFKTITFQITYDLGGCFAYGTKINMYDGSYKLIENLNVGDTIMSCNIQGLPDESIGYNEWTKWISDTIDGVLSYTVVTVTKHYKAEYYYIINDKIKVTYEHQFLINRPLYEGSLVSNWSWLPAMDLKVGYELYTINQTKEIISSIEKINEPIDVVLVNTEDLDVFYAEGILSHNKEE